MEIVDETHAHLQVTCDHAPSPQHSRLQKKKKRMIEG